MPGVVASPGNLHDRRPVRRTAHPRRVSLEEHPDRPVIQRPPPATLPALVIARRPPSATAAALLGRTTPTNMSDQNLGILVEIDPFDHRARVKAQQPTPYLDGQHPVSPCSRTFEQSENVGTRRGATASAHDHRPHKGQESHKDRGIDGSRWLATFSGDGEAAR